MNSITLMGRFVADPELKTLQSGSQICNFKLAVDRRLKREGEPTADFFPCIAFNKTAEHISKWFAKGKMIAVEGRVQNRTWTDDNNAKHYITEVVVNDTYFCGDSNKDSADKSSKPDTSSKVDESIPDAEDEEMPF